MKSAPAQYGLIGFPVAHSASPAWFEAKFAREKINADYKAFPLADIRALPELLREYPRLLGLNVTKPHKMTVIPFLDGLDDAARKIGAVNCIRIDGGRLTGYNTDARGFEQSFLPLLREHHLKALVLGTGGASKAVGYVLNKLDIPHHFVSRDPAPGALAYADLDRTTIYSHPLIINTTPLGMYPDVADAPPIPYQYLTAGHLLYDLIYNPAETQFLHQGLAAGATVSNGRQMLELQAQAAWEIWNPQE